MFRLFVRQLGAPPIRTAADSLHAVSDTVIPRRLWLALSEQGDWTPTPSGRPQKKRGYSKSISAWPRRIWRRSARAFGYGLGAPIPTRRDLPNHFSNSPTSRRRALDPLW